MRWEPNNEIRLDEAIYGSSICRGYESGRFKIFKYDKEWRVGFFDEDNSPSVFIGPEFHLLVKAKEFAEGFAAMIGNASKSSEVVKVPGLREFVDKFHKPHGGSR